MCASFDDDGGYERRRRRGHRGGSCWTRHVREPASRRVAAPGHRPRARVARHGSSHYDRLHLHTVKRYSSLPFSPWPRETPLYPSRADVVSYLERYAEQHRIAPRFGVEVRRVTRESTHFTVDTSAGRLEPRFVVVATGYNGVANRPAFPGLAGFSRSRGAHRRPTRIRSPTWGSARSSWGAVTRAPKSPLILRNRASMWRWWCADRCMWCRAICWADPLRKRASCSHACPWPCATPSFHRSCAWPSVTFPVGESFDQRSGPRD